jgi:CubicO group peptidase (beta-lactamase class C family)
MSRSRIGATVVAGLLVCMPVWTSGGLGGEMVFPGVEWEEATPESQGFDSTRLAEAVEYLRANSGRDGVRELLILSRGRLIHKGDNIDNVHGVWSCTKSFTSTVLGLLVEDGKCSLETRASRFVPELADDYPEVSLRHFTTMTSGYRALGDEPKGSYLHGPSSTPFQPGQPLFAPGTRYAYWDSAMNLFGLVLTRAAGEPLEQLFKRRIADPIGMNPRQWAWGDYATVDGLVVNGGSGNGGKHVTISARQMARLGHLFLNKGNWNGRQLLRREWVEAATSVQVPASLPWAQPESEIDGRGVYGFNWWVNGATRRAGLALPSIDTGAGRASPALLKWPGAPPGTFAASGHNNNRMFVIPEWKLVIVRLGLDQQDGRIADEIWSRFLQLVGEARTGEKRAESLGAGRFRHHYIDRQLPGTSYGQTSLVDLDRDGDLDFVTGGRDGSRSVFWFEHQYAETWVRHVLGTEHPSDVGGTALDVDGDGWIDHVAGGVWYQNPGKPRDEPFERIVFDAELRAVHDLVAADLDRDGRTDIVTMSDKNNLRWYRIPPDPRQRWQRYDIGPGVHAGVAVGDLDGDGDPDIIRSNAWFENADGTGTRWTEHAIPFGKPTPPYPLATRCRVADLDLDGDADLVMTENEIRAGRIAWLENKDGRGREWTVHDLPAGDVDPRGAYHSLAVADFDNDGDQDIFTVEMEAIAGSRPPRWFIWENLDGLAGQFAERVIFDGRLGGHEAVVADVDTDGDLDLCSKLWRPRPDNANGGRNHADYLENTLIQRQPPGR